MTYKPKTLVITLLSATTFTAGEARPGEVDIEIEHDELGLPRIGGKRLRSLLRDTWLSMSECFSDSDPSDSDLWDAGIRVFGRPGDTGERAILRIGSAELNEAVLQYVRAAVHRERHPIHPLEILHSLTSVRSQTSECRESGAPLTGTLRSSRVARSGLVFEAPLDWLEDPGDNEVDALALVALGTRHAGLARNRGRGFVRMSLDGDDHRTRQRATAREVKP